jgi:hypothetical protein
MVTFAKSLLLAEVLGRRGVPHLILPLQIGFACQLRQSASYPPPQFPTFDLPHFAPLK